MEAGPLLQGPIDMAPHQVFTSSDQHSHPPLLPDPHDDLKMHDDEFAQGPPNQMQLNAYQGPPGGQMIPMEYEDIIGAIKVTDGIFIGDRYAAKDLHFITQNKVTHIINCAGLQVRNHYEDFKAESSNEAGPKKKVHYLTFLWIDTDS